MTNVLFTHSYFYQLDAKQWRFKQPYPPLATITAAGFLRNLGYGVQLFDTALSRDPSGITKHIQLHQPKFVVICDDGFNYLTKMCLTVMRDAAVQMAKIAKKLGCIVIVSSSDAADHYEKYFRAGVDYVVKGEVEHTLFDLLQCIEKRGDVGLVEGVIHKKGGVTRVNAPRNVAKNLDAIPTAAWDLIDIASYRKIWFKHHGYFSLNVATTRGCPFKCNWCAKPIYGNRYNSRSPENVIEEIEMLQKDFDVKDFWMTDDIFGLKPGWIQRFNKIVQEKNLRFRYKIQSRADLLLEADTIQALAESGAETVWIGAESGSQKILDAMEKGTTVEQIKTATHLLREHGIRVGFFLQFGYPGETDADIRSTIEMMLALLPDEVGISISYPLPGTAFFEKVKSQLDRKQNWTDSDDLDLMFNSTFNNVYYRHLHQYVHSIYRKKKGFAVLRKLLSEPLRLNRKEVRSGLAAFYHVPSSMMLGWKLDRLKSSQIHFEKD